MKAFIIALALALPGDRIEADCYDVVTTPGIVNLTSRVCHFQPRGFEDVNVHCWGVANGLSCVQVRR